MKNVGIIDYGMGNIQSISNSLNFNSINSDFISISCEIKKYDTIILPGVVLWKNNEESRNEKLY